MTETLATCPYDVAVSAASDSAPHGSRATRWSLVARAADRGPAGRRALEELCTLYWPAVYAFYRREGEDTESARDLTQGLIADLLERGAFAAADRKRGRFRAFLRTCARNFAANERAKRRTQKRGGPRSDLPLDFTHEEQQLRSEPIDHLDAEAVFERRWAQAVIDAALLELEREESANGRGRLFTVLRPTLEGDALDRPYAEVSAELGISEGAFKVTAHRLRRRFRARLLEEVGHTLTDETAAEDEIRYLLTALQAGR